MSYNAVHAPRDPRPKSPFNVRAPGLAERAPLRVGAPRVDLPRGYGCAQMRSTTDRIRGIYMRAQIRNATRYCCPNPLPISRVGKRVFFRLFGRRGDVRACVQKKNKNRTKTKRTFLSGETKREEAGETSPAGCYRSVFYVRSAKDAAPLAYGVGNLRQSGRHHIDGQRSVVEKTFVRNV